MGHGMIVECAWHGGDVRENRSTTVKITLRGWEAGDEVQINVGPSAEGQEEAAGAHWCSWLAVCSPGASGEHT